MAAVFEGGGIRFQYPENWTIEEGPTEEGWSVTLQSPHTAFMLLNVYPDRPAVRTVLDTALAALREEYPDLEAADVTEKFASHRAQGFDVQFFSMDLTNSCWIRGLRTTEKTILILCQVSDLELESAEPVLRAVRASMELAEA